MNVYERLNRRTCPWCYGRGYYYAMGEDRDELLRTCDLCHGKGTLLPSNNPRMTHLDSRLANQVPNPRV